MVNKFNEQANLYNNGEGLCLCKYPKINGICSNPDCPTKTAYDNGYKATSKQEKSPIIEIEE